MMARVRHGYGNTRGVSKTGTAGTGTVVRFNTPQYTAYPYRGIAGMHGYIPKVIFLYILYFNYYLGFCLYRCDFQAEF